MSRAGAQLTAGNQQAGFALPLALAAIALLSIITIAGYRAVSGAADIAMDLQDNARDEQALFTAESEATFVYLTGVVVSGGVKASAVDAQPVDPFAGQVDPEALGRREYWRAVGEPRLSATRDLAVIVAYYDATGFPPVAALPEDQMADLLVGAGFDSDAAAQFAARIADYQDPENQRRFRGAERADYRLFGAPPPTDSPLRSAGELASVLGFAAAIPYSGWDFLLENSRFGNSSTIFNPYFGSQAIIDLFVDADDSLAVTDPFDTLASENAQPSDTARFLLSYRTESGLTRRRATEIMRTANAADKPFRRTWIYDKVKDDDVTAPAADERTDMAPVFQPTPAANPG